MVHILIDSTSDLTREEAASWGITVAPLTVRFGSTEYQDGVDLTPPVFFRKLEESKVVPVTSQVNSGVFMELYKSLLQNREDEILGIFLSSRLSGTYQSARIARNTFPRRSIHLVDSGTASLGAFLLIREAVRLRDQGLSAGEIAGELNRLKGRVRILAALESLKYLLKGGRLPAASAIVGTLLHVKPILSVRDGNVDVAKKVRGNLAAYQWMAGELSEKGYDPRYTPQLGSTQCAVLLDTFRQKLRDQGLDIAQWGHTDVGVVIGTHTGPGCVGVAYIEKE